jgi:hypothetical protein
MNQKTKHTPSHPIFDTAVARPLNPEEVQIYIKAREAMGNPLPKDAPPKK